MYTVHYGGKAGFSMALEESDQLVAVRTVDRGSVMPTSEARVTPLSLEARTVLGEFNLMMQLPFAGVEVLQTRTTRGDRALRDQARTILKQEPEIQFAGRVLVDPVSQAPVLYTENLFVKFDDDAKATAIRKILKQHQLTVKRELEYARNAYFVEAPNNIGLQLFELADQLLDEAEVALCHPELVREMRKRQSFPNQWHLKRVTINRKSVNAHAFVEAAWPFSEGAGVTIAIIDDGVDVDHEEFRSSNKIVAPRDVTRRVDDARPGNGDNHGTACAGVACADGLFGASGVAPKARLLPIRLASGLGSQAEADAFIHAARNGADVISCSWGPTDGDWWDPNDPLHNQNVPLPDSTRLAMDWAIQNGRGGKGCVILFAAGNGNESVDLDGYASYEKVIAVAAANDSSKRSIYSDFGQAVWCAFPSNDLVPSKTPGIWTTDRSGPSGYNDGHPNKGDILGNYTNGFGGTSSAAPGAAGVAALILARNPNLRWDEVREIMKQSCDKIDKTGGKYDANGRSPFYGFGRLNAQRAVELAMPAQPTPTVTATATQDVPIADLKSARLDVAVAETRNLAGLKIAVDIEHTYIGDLVVTIQPPEAMGSPAILLHNRSGGSTNNLHTSYDGISTPGLAVLVGKSPEGTWTLVVEDQAELDTGKIRSFSVIMEFW
jgi:subtilisin family serine protease